MPNHVLNELVFSGIDEAEQKRVIAALCGADGTVDFGILVPPPLNLWRGSVGSQHEAAFARTSLDWNTENWGTKWNAYNSAPPDHESDRLTVRFQTAWRPPYPWLAAVFNSLRLPFRHHWLDEGKERGVVGIFRLDGLWGDEWSESPADDDMQRRLHKLLWGVEAFEDEE